VYVWTHDSVGLGEDGPTHQPIEHLAALRAMPNLAVLRPADANETAEAWRWALLQTGQPIALVLSRQKLPVLAGTREKAREGLARGGYVLREAQGGTPRLILIATGSEVSLAFQAADLLERSGAPTRVVSLPCWSTFEAQGRAYHDLVLPPTIGARVSIEAGATFGWSRWIGDRGRAVGLDRFGASAPGEVNLAKLGMTVESVVAAARAVLDAH
jgi:transketolase